MPQGFTARVLRSLRTTEAGGVWLPILSPRVLGLATSHRDTIPALLIRTSDREEHRSANDAVLDGDRLFVLYLDRIDAYAIHVDPGS